MRIAVVGGTGLVGRWVVEALRSGGHAALMVARSRWIDLTTGEGLDEALTGVETVIDVTNTPETDPAREREFFETTTEANAWLTPTGRAA